MSKREGSFFKRHKVISVLGILIVIGIIGSALGGGNTSNNSASNSSDGSGVTKTENKQATVAKLNEPANDGKFSFTVSSVECGKTSVGTNEYLTKTAQGQFCFVNLSVKNIGDKPQGFFGINQKLLNAQDQQYAADDTAGAYLDQSYSTLFSNINPGNEVKGVLVFDIPKDQTPVAAQLYDSAFSSGVRVNLQ